MPKASMTMLLGPTLLLSLLFLAIAGLTRLALTLSTGTALVPLPLWPSIAGLGLWFDLAVLAWLLAPLLLLSALRRRRDREARWRPGARLLAFFLAIALLLFGALAEWTFWGEFATRFNFIAVDYLIYTHEVIGNLVESYPVAALLAGIVVLATAGVWVMRRRILAPVSAPSGLARLGLASLAVALPWSAWHLADIDQMRFSNNTYANELAGNGLMTFAAALRRNELEYERFYHTLPDADAHRILAGLGVEREPISQALGPGHDESESFDVRRLPFKGPPRNVVLISVESLSAAYLGAFGDTRGLTPRLDALIRDGMLYSRIYATGTRTVRGLEALSLGTPPIPGQAIVRRPGNEHLATVGEILRRQGYETLFIYGGYGYFDNMNAYFAGNDYRVIDRTDFPKASVDFANVWGVADEFLFDNALSRLDQTHATGRPFLAHIMTTSNHRPYTYPDGRIDIPSPGGREGAVKYTDYAIGRFIEQAGKKPWFADTLFVIVADHCASAAGKTSLPVKGYHIPLILYAPRLLPPGHSDRLGSQIDIPPTLLDVMGLAGDGHFFGKSLFEQGKDAPRAFISNYQELGYLKQGRLTVLGPKRRVEAYLIDANGDARPAPVDERLRDEAVAYYQTAFKVFKQGELKLR
ncbi:MAG: sulfatase-like hydrolase/transferase [Thiobacillaceae bacterium]|nr:sulfatase-like hydrolase/transferase [Thiobacillaceae bacterium]